MRLQLLKLAAKRPLVALFGALLLVGAAVAAPIALVASSGGSEASAANPRSLIGRLWLDRYPGKPRDEVDLILFFGSGFGVYEHGSRYKASMEFFEFERQGGAVEVHFFQDDSRMKTKFEISACSDDRNFDLCLDFKNSPRGPKRYYSWGRDGDDAAHVPWAEDWKRGAEARVTR
ncbi:MAG: hypothetical protein U0414_27145 [Polyangiaceae bacterium]